MEVIMDQSYRYRKLESGWVKTHECEELTEYNKSFREAYEIEDEVYEKVMILKEISESTWEMNIAVSDPDEDDFVEFEAIDIRYCPYCSEYLREGVEEVPEEAKLVMGE